MNIEQRREKDREYYRKHRDSIIAKRMERYYKFKKKWYDGVCCYMCSIKFNIHYHHLDPKIKSFGIAECWWKKDEQIQKEVNKCIPLCGNCHRIVHMIVNPLIGVKID